MKFLIFYEDDPQHTKGSIETTVKSIREFSPDTEVWIIGDKQVPGACTVPVTHYSRLAEPLEEPYRRVHRSAEGLPAWFEWRSVKRWLVFCEFCQKTGTHSFWTCDADVLWLCNAEDEAERYKGRYVGVQKPYANETIITLGISCFWEWTILLAFKKWLEETLSSEAGKALASYSDMALWTVFLGHLPGIGSTYLTDCRDGGSFDPNLCCLEGWENDGKSKVLTWEKGFPYGVRNGKKERLKALHCWGPHKTRMAEYLALALASR